MAGLTKFLPTVILIEMLNQDKFNHRQQRRNNSIDNIAQFTENKTMAVRKKFIDRFSERFDDLDQGSRQAYLLRLVRERGFFETVFNNRLLLLWP